MKLSLPALREMKLSGAPIVMITAYDHPSGRIVDEAGVELVLVGDSAATTVLGYESTVPATMNELLMLTGAVARAVRRAIVVGDMPFMSYQVSNEDAIRNAGRFVKEAGADVVKLEGAGASLERIRALTDAGIPVMAHLGLTPQTATQLGGLRAQGRSWQAARQLFEDAVAVEAAGAFALVLECVPPPVAARITRRLAIPTIGIGSGDATDGQVLVLHDLLGLSDARARFVKRFAEVGAAMADGVAAYAAEVRERRYPGPEHTYPMPAEELSAFETAIDAAGMGTNTLADW
jgi:3-methyl-2-oxobutanoate hydroxymethyltransferase